MVQLTKTGPATNETVNSENRHHGSSQPETSRATATSWIERRTICRSESSSCGLTLDSTRCDGCQVVAYQSSQPASAPGLRLITGSQESWSLAG